MSFSRRRAQPAARTLGRKALRRITKAERTAAPADEPPPRPQTRADCADGPRPCPWIGCRHHLYLEVKPDSGTIRLNFPEIEPWELQHSCSLDVAEMGQQGYDMIGRLMNISHTRVVQIIEDSAPRLRRRLRTE